MKSYLLVAALGCALVPMGSVNAAPAFLGPPVPAVAPREAPELTFSIRHQIRAHGRDLTLKRDGTVSVKSWAGTQQTGPEVTRLFTGRLTDAEKRAITSAFRRARVATLPSQLSGMAFGSNTFTLATKVAGRTITTSGFVAVDFGRYDYAKPLINDLVALTERVASSSTGATSTSTGGLISALGGASNSSTSSSRAHGALPARGSSEVQPLYRPTVPQQGEVRPLSPALGQGSARPSLPASSGGVQPLYPPTMPGTGEIYPLYPATGPALGGFGGLPDMGTGEVQPLYPPLAPQQGEVRPYPGVF